MEGRRKKLAERWIPVQSRRRRIVRRVVPDRWFDRIVMHITGLDRV